MPKNVVFIVLDTTRKDRLSLYNDEVTFTQHLEEFAEDAAVFEDAVAQAPWTLPSHASMFTGDYPWEHGATQEKLYLETDRTLLAERFADNGYRTACYTSNTWISPYIGMTDGFQDVDNFFPVLPSNLLPDVFSRVWQRLNHGHGSTILSKLMDIGGYIHERLAQEDTGSKTSDVIEKAETFIADACDNDELFFLFINLMDAHLPYYPPESYREQHAPQVDADSQCQDSSLHNGGKTTADFDALRKLYDAEIDYMDDMLGRFFAFCEQNGLYEDTVFVVVADHGENLGEDDMFGHQFSVSEQLVSVPLIVRTPGNVQEDTDQQVELRELYNLIPAYAGIADKTEIGTTYAKGRYAYPQLDLQNIPEKHHDELGTSLTFVRGNGRKLVKDGTGVEHRVTLSEAADGDFTVLEDHLPDIEDTQQIAGTEDVLPDADDQVKDRLEDLGYL